MLQRIKHLSFRIKLFLFTLSIAFFSIAIVSSALIYFDYTAEQYSVSRQLSTIGEIVALSPQDAVAIEDVIRSTHHQHLKDEIYMGVGITLLVMIAAFILTYIAHNFLARPITELTQTMHRLTGEQDYSIRAQKYADDELGELTDDFNSMLDTLQNQYDELTSTQQYLEDRIRERTDHMIEEVRIRTEAELKMESYNQDLKSEIAHRVNAENRLERYSLELQESNTSLEVAIDQANNLSLQAQAASASKTDFLANMSHEIRTPMNAILGFIEFILETDLDEEQYGFAQSVQKASNHLMTIINEILDFSKIEAGKLELEAIPFDLCTVTEDAIDTMHIRAFEKSLSMACMIHSNVPNNLVGDPGRLRQVLINLVGNALKFTERGEVVLHVALDEYNEAEGNLKLLFSISDTGVGVPEDKIEGLFDSFSQADTSTTREFGGTGLGLTISKRIVNMMEGDIGASSTLGKGSTFWFSALFQLPHDHRQEAEAPPIDGKGKRVLTYSTNTTTANVLNFHMNTQYINCDSALDAENALTLLRNSQSNGTPYDLLILDTEDLDKGTSALVQALFSNAETPSPPIILLTYIGTKDLPKEFNELSRAVYINKPIRQAHLLEAINNAFHPTSLPLEELSTTINGAAPEMHLGPIRILLAEDNPMNQEVARRILTSMGCHITIAENGQEACEIPLTQHFDVILMDVQMPVMSGIDATIAIRAREEGTDTRTPIIAMTAHTMEEQRELCLGAGMDDYLTKPIDKKMLYAALTQYATLGSNHTARSVETDVPAPDTSTNGVETMMAHEESTAPPLDLTRLNGITDGDTAILHQLLNLFLTDISEFAPKLPQALSNNNNEALAEAAHRIKGGAGQVGAETLHSLAATLESMGRENNLAKAQDTLEEFNQEYARVVNFLEQTLQS